MSVCIVNFSSRGDGNCARISRFLQELSGGVVHSFSEMDVKPCGSCGYECFRGGECPRGSDGILELMETIADSSMTFFVLPNYCGFPCANFFVFNERGVAWFRGSKERLRRYLAAPKRAIVVSNTESEHIAEALSYQADHEVRTLFLGSREFGQRSTDGNLMDVEAVRDRIRRFTEEAEDMEL